MSLTSNDYFPSISWLESHLLCFSPPVFLLSSCLASSPRSFHFPEYFRLLTTYIYYCSHQKRINTVSPGKWGWRCFSHSPAVGLSRYFILEPCPLPTHHPFPFLQGELAQLQVLHDFPPAGLCSTSQLCALSSQAARPRVQHPTPAPSLSNQPLALYPHHKSTVF